MSKEKNQTPDEGQEQKGVTVSEVRYLNHELGMAIFKLLEEFEKTTGCAVTRVDVSRTLLVEFDANTRASHSVLSSVETTINLLGSTGSK